MSYEYTALNQWEKPHSYMYSEFGGSGFLQTYKEDRLSRLALLNTLPVTSTSANEATAHVFLRDFLLRDGSSPPVQIDLSLCEPREVSLADTEPLGSFTLDETIQTTGLIDLLLYRFMNDADGHHPTNEEVLWLDRLIQRFEVTKRIWSHYLPGFRKGAGVEFDAALYGSFALLLALAYARSEKLQYLSTLLKANDLLLSLPKESLGGANYCSLTLAVAIELSAVRKLTTSLEG